MMSRGAGAGSASRFLRTIPKFSWLSTLGATIGTAGPNGSSATSPSLISTRLCSRPT